MLLSCTMHKQEHASEANLIFDSVLVASILEKVELDEPTTSRSEPLSFQELAQTLSTDEYEIIDQLLAINPTRLGFYGEFVGYDDPPANLVAISGQHFDTEEGRRFVPTQYLPRHVWSAFQDMQLAMHRDIGGMLMVKSGYRSPAHQAIVFLTYLQACQFDITKVSRSVALPGYSQHGANDHTAIDVMEEHGLPGDAYPQFFAVTPAYEWMLAHAAEFGFYLSYPDGNNDGIIFEPWHWQYRGQSKTIDLQAPSEAA